MNYPGGGMPQGQPGMMPGFSNGQPGMYHHQAAGGHPPYGVQNQPNMATQQSAPMQQMMGGDAVNAGDYKHLSSVLAESSGVSTTAFDNLEELVWVGTNQAS